MPIALDHYRKRLADLAAEGVFIGTSSWKYPDWCGQVYTESRYITRGKFSEAKFNRSCLAEYAETYRTVCVDAGYYQFTRVAHQRVTLRGPRDEPHKGDAVFTWSATKKLLAERGVELLSAGLDEVPSVYKDIHAVTATQADLGRCARPVRFEAREDVKASSFWRPPFCRGQGQFSKRAGADPNRAPTRFPDCYTPLNIVELHWENASRCSHFCSHLSSQRPSPRRKPLRTRERGGGGNRTPE